jgi:hypothetical protein
MLIFRAGLELPVRKVERHTPVVAYFMTQIAAATPDRMQMSVAGPLETVHEPGPV